MRGKLNKIAAYQNNEELCTFKLRVMASGLTESMYIREMLSFDVRGRGAPKGKRETTGKVKSTRRTKTKGGSR
jgi:hypothetical protein